MNKFILTIISIVVLLIVIFRLHSYLSLNIPIHSEILVIEGWLDYDYLPIVLEEFNRNNYDRIVVVGNTHYSSKGSCIDGNQSNAELKARQLSLLSNHTLDVVVVNSKYVTKNQTFNYMVCFKNWLVKEIPDIKSVNLFSASVHARKSYILLRRVLPHSIKVGVISAPPLRYNKNYWWLSKRGILLVFKNAISLLDAVLFDNCRILDC